MRIPKIDIPKSGDDGLDHLKMDRLGKIVLLAGKNGAGKSRILNKIFPNLKARAVEMQLKRVTEELDEEKNNVSVFEKAIKVLMTDNWISGRDSNSPYMISVAELEKLIKKSKKKVRQLESALDLIEIEEINYKLEYEAVNFVPKAEELLNCKYLSDVERFTNASLIELKNISDLPKAVTSLIQVIQDRWYNVVNSKEKVSDEIRNSAVGDYNRLCNNIQILLGTQVGRTSDGEATLFGLPLSTCNLSEGQKIIIQFCIVIISRETELKDLILVMDEPENHLHPSIVVEILDVLDNCLYEGQIWIATHSVTILAHYDPSMIWFVDKGKVAHAGKIPEKVLQSLLGDENEISKIQDFIGLPAQYAMHRFAFECLIEPTSIMTGGSDPQSIQIRKELLKISGNNKIRVLDYGAGQGRLISNILDLDRGDQLKILNNLDYIAYDKSETGKASCLSVIRRIYRNFLNRYFNDMHDLLSTYDKRSFDVVIMCNVLHEVDPNDWLKLFYKEGTISSLLTENGVLLLVEDHQMPIGEKAYQKGFLVIDTPQIKELFKILEKDKGFMFSDQRGDGRLKAHIIPKKCLVRITEESRLDALKSISSTAREKILEIREKEKSYLNGKIHAFWTQQFSNSQISLAQLTSKVI